MPVNTSVPIPQGVGKGIEHLREVQRIERDVQRIVDPSGMQDLQLRQWQQTQRFRDNGGISDLAPPSPRSQGSSTTTTSTSPSPRITRNVNPNWARNIDFGDASSPAEAVINDTIQQVAPYIFPEQFAPVPYSDTSQGQIEAEWNRLNENLDELLRNQNSLRDSFNDAFEDLLRNFSPSPSPQTQPNPYPSPSMDCKHHYLLQRPSGIATYENEALLNQYWIYSIEGKTEGVASMTAFALEGESWIEDTAYSYTSEFPGEWQTISSGNSYGEQKIDIPLPETTIYESKSSGRLNPRSNSGILNNFRFSNNSSSSLRINVVAPFSPNLNGTFDVEVPDTAPRVAINSFDPNTCTLADQGQPPPPPPPPRRREDMQCLAERLIGRLDRIIALLEHNVLTEAQIDQIAASAKGLKAQTKTLKALRQEAIAAVPDYWQNRVNQRPQLVLQFARKLANGKYGAPNILLTIAHFPNRKPSENSPPIRYFDHGNEMGILVLKDNSKITVNCSSQAEAKRVVGVILSKVNRSQRPASTNPRIGPRGGAPIKSERVYCRIAKYFSKGQAKMQPDWVVYFK